MRRQALTGATGVRGETEHLADQPRGRHDPNSPLPVGVLARLRSGQERVLASLLTEARLNRLVEQEALDGASAYPATVFLADLRAGLWRELDESPVRIDAYRLNIERVYLGRIDEQLNGASPVGGDARPFLRGELRALGRDIVSALDQVADRATRLHLEDVHDQITQALTPPARTAAARSRSSRARDGGLLDVAPADAWVSEGLHSGPFGVPEICWPDYGISARP